MGSEEKIAESLELNNIAELVVNISEGEEQVKPNPFTPNGDGMNDQVLFDFTQLDLKKPELKIFAFEGWEIMQLPPKNEAMFYWDGIDAHGKPLSPGIYLYVLTDGDKTVSKGYVVLAR